MKKLLLILLCVFDFFAQQTNRFWEIAAWTSLVMVGVFFIVQLIKWCFIKISKMFGKLTPNTNLKLKSRNEGKTMVWVKCNHCGKNTRKDHPLFLAIHQFGAKELDKNLTEIKEQYQDEDTR